MSENAITFDPPKGVRPFKVKTTFRVKNWTGYGGQKHIGYGGGYGHYGEYGDAYNGYTGHAGNGITYPSRKNTTTPKGYTPPIGRPNKQHWTKDLSTAKFKKENEGLQDQLPFAINDTGETVDEILDRELEEECNELCGPSHNFEDYFLMKYLRTKNCAWCHGLLRIERSAGVPNLWWVECPDCGTSGPREETPTSACEAAAVTLDL